MTDKKTFLYGLFKSSFRKWKDGTCIASKGPLRGFLSVTFNVLLYSLLVSIWQAPLQAQTSSYPMCHQFGELPEKDNFCPRIEGQYPKGCCPPIKGPRKTCYYAEFRSRGQVALVNSSYRVCESGQTVSKPCCALSHRPCYANLSRRNFISFLTYRSDASPKGCCFAICPSASYWSSHPNANLRLPGTYFRLGETIPPNLCRSEIIDVCAYGGRSCGTSQPCPRPPPPHPSDPGPPLRPSDPGPPGPPNPGPPRPPKSRSATPPKSAHSPRGSRLMYPKRKEKEPFATLKSGRLKKINVTVCQKEERFECGPLTF